MNKLTAQNEKNRMAILDRIGMALGRDNKDDLDVAPSRTQIQLATRSPSPPNLVDKFCKRVINSAASVIVINNQQDIPRHVAGYLQANNILSPIITGSDPRLRQIPWQQTSLITIATRPIKDDDVVGMSYATAGIAETGTLILRSGQDNPTSINFLTEHHIIIVEENDIVAYAEDVWKLLRVRFPKSPLPRALNWITGPSRTADIEQTIQLGAHGPRYLHVVIVIN